MLRHAGLILCWVLLSGVASYAGDDAGRKIIEQCASKIKQAHVVSYEVDYKGTAWVAKRVGEVSGKVVVGGRSEWDVDEFWCDVTLKKHDSEEAIHLMAGSDGDQYFLIDPKTKMAHLDMDPAVLGSQGRNVRRAIFRQYTSKEPMKDVLEAKKIELQGTELVGQEACHKIEVIEEDDSRSVWFISQKDYLPRRVVGYHVHPEHGEGTTDLTMSHVKIDPRMDHGPFKLVVPAGFTKTDDFAP